MIGRMVSHYNILEELGRGGMGVVYKARDTKLDRVVALKFLPPHFGADEVEKERFIHEAKAASALQHNNICTIHEIDETENGQMFICMDLYEGETLKQKIGKGPLAIEAAIDIALQVAEGLSHAHQKNIVHRDIKPANIFITQDGIVKIVDFGLAKLRGVTKLTVSGTTLGTAAYMSPEQARGDEVSSRTDVWAFGVVLYEMLTGRQPFGGDYEQALIYAILNEDPEPVTALRTGIPMALERLIHKCLAKDPARRYQHFQDVLVDLKAVQEKSRLGSKVVIKPTPKHRRSVSAILVIPILFLVVTLAGLYFFARKKTDKIDSIAVLPLVNLSGDPNQEYFSDGMTEAVIAELANLRALKVISRTSIMRYKNTEKALPEIAKALDVDAIVEGSILRVEDRVRITTQLIDGRSDRHLWAKNYERNLNNILEIQGEVAKDIASEIRVNLDEQEKMALSTRAQSIDPEAYDAYLRGLYYWNKRTEEGLKKGIDCFKQAIEKEPQYAAAYAALSQSYIVLAAWSFISYSASHEKARMMAEKALEINNRLAEAHTALGAVYEGEWKWKEAQKEYKHAIELNPNYATGHQWYAEFLSLLGQHQKAIGEMEKALALDPLSLIINHNFALIFFFARDYNGTLEQIKKTNELEKNFGATLYYTYLTYIEKGMYPEAIETYKELLSQNERTTHLAESVDAAFKSKGIQGVFRWIIDHVDEVSRQSNTRPITLAINYARLGEKDEAFKWLEVMVENRLPRLHYIKVMPYLDSIRSDPRYLDLLKRMNLE
jgi:serine/threonine protein kinase/tetratricopeptide (TPR) repeat protein